MWLLFMIMLILVLIVIGAIGINNDSDAGPAFMVLAFLAGIAMLIMLPFLGLYPGYSDGVRDGYVVNLSHKGVFFKTWEATMQPGAGQQASLQQPWDFSVTDPEVLKQIQALEGKRVEITYEQSMVLPVTEGDTDYLAVAVTVLPDSK